MEIAMASKEHINKYKMAHMVGVAEYMRERASDYGLNPDEMYVVGLLHDIGYLKGRAGHELSGAMLLDRMGLLKYSFAIEFHGNKLREMFTDYLFNKSEHIGSFDRKTKGHIITLLVEADSSVDVRGFRVGFEKRLKDIGERYGYHSAAYETVSDNIAFIKEYQRNWGIGKPIKLYHKEKIPREKE